MNKNIAMIRGKKIFCEPAKILHQPTQARSQEFAMWGLFRRCETKLKRSSLGSCSDFDRFRARN